MTLHPLCITSLPYMGTLTVLLLLHLNLRLMSFHVGASHTASAQTCLHCWWWMKAPIASQWTHQICQGSGASLRPPAPRLSHWWQPIKTMVVPVSQGRVLFKSPGKIHVMVQPLTLCRSWTCLTLLQSTWTNLLKPTKSKFLGHMTAVRIPIRYQQEIWNPEVTWL